MSLVYEIGLSLLPGVGDKIGKALVDRCGSAEAVFRENYRSLLRIPDIGRITARKIVSQNVLQRAEEEILFMEKHGIRALFYQSADYPYRLRQCADSPLVLYYKGNIDLNAKKMLSIVGTRRCTDYGREICQQIISDLSEEGVVIVSGLAYGIDSCAHRCALDAGLDTLGVLGHGLDRIYPYQNRLMAVRMTEQGGLLTDFMSQTRPDAINFPSRNRIIAGISDAVLVIEAASKGGALITAELANSYSREVFAIPGRIDQEFSKGCHYLIKTHRAALVEHANDLRYHLNWEASSSSPEPRQQKLIPLLSDDQKIIFDLLANEDRMPIDTLCHKTTMPLSRVTTALLEMELQGFLRSYPGNVYGLLH